MATFDLKININTNFDTWTTNYNTLADKLDVASPTTSNLETKANDVISLNINSIVNKLNYLLDTTDISLKNKNITLKNDFITHENTLKNIQSDYDIIGNTVDTLSNNFLLILNSLNNIETVINTNNARMLLALNAQPIQLNRISTMETVINSFFISKLTGLVAVDEINTQRLNYIQKNINIKKSTSLNIKNSQQTEENDINDIKTFISFQTTRLTALELKYNGINITSYGTLLSNDFNIQNVLDVQTLFITDAKIKLTDIENENLATIGIMSGMNLIDSGYDTRLLSIEALTLPDFNTTLNTLASNDINQNNRLDIIVTNRNSLTTSINSLNTIKNNLNESVLGIDIDQDNATPIPPTVLDKQNANKTKYTSLNNIDSNTSTAVAVAQNNNTTQENRLTILESLLLTNDIQYQIQNPTFVLSNSMNLNFEITDLGKETALKCYFGYRIKDKEYLYSNYINVSVIGIYTIPVLSLNNNTVYEIILIIEGLTNTWVKLISLPITQITAV